MHAGIITISCYIRTVLLHYYFAFVRDMMDLFDFHNSDNCDAYDIISCLNERLLMVQGILRLASGRMHDLRREINRIRLRIRQLTRHDSLVLRHDLENRLRLYDQWKRRFRFMVRERRRIVRHLDFMNDDLFW